MWITFYPEERWDKSAVRGIWGQSTSQAAMSENLFSQMTDSVIWGMIKAGNKAVMKYSSCSAVKKKKGFWVLRVHRLARRRSEDWKSGWCHPHPPPSFPLLVLYTKHTAWRHPCDSAPRRLANCYRGWYLLWRRQQKESHPLLEM